MYTRLMLLAKPSGTGGWSRDGKNIGTGELEVLPLLGKNPTLIVLGVKVK
jgi:hypothetical protein